MVVTLGQQYDVGEKPSVILYTYINRQQGHDTKQCIRSTSASLKINGTQRIQRILITFL